MTESYKGPERKGPERLEVLKQMARESFQAADALAWDSNGYNPEKSRLLQQADEAVRQIAESAGIEPGEVTYEFLGMKKLDSKDERYAEKNGPEVFEGIGPPEDKETKDRDEILNQIRAGQDKIKELLMRKEEPTASVADKKAIEKKLGDARRELEELYDSILDRSGMGRLFEFSNDWPREWKREKIERALGGDALSENEFENEIALKKSEDRKAREAQDRQNRIDQRRERVGLIENQLLKSALANVYAGEASREDLLVLYEIDEKLQNLTEVDRRELRGFLQDRREANGKEEDLLVIFDCKEAQVARTVADINDETKAYVGKFESGIFKSLPDAVKYIYIEAFPFFPGRRIWRENIQIGGDDNLVDSLKEKGISVDDATASVLDDEEVFPVIDNQREIALVRFSRATLEGDRVCPGVKAARDIVFMAQNLGLEYCPTEVVPRYVLSSLSRHNQQSSRLNFVTEPKKFADKHDPFFIFTFYAPNSGEPAKLRASITDEHRNHPCGSDDEFVFALPNKKKSRRSMSS